MPWIERLKEWVQGSWGGRVLLTVVLGLLFGWALSEGSFFILKDSSDHTPGRVVLTIPAGTAEQVKRGEAPPSIPSSLAFVVGDTLVVKNEDSVSHQLGPVWVPPGATSSIALNEVNDFAYACTFQITRYFGLNVHARVTLVTRIQALALTGPPMSVLLFVYSLVLWPHRKRYPAEKLSV